MSRPSLASSALPASRVTRARLRAASASRGSPRARAGGWDASLAIALAFARVLSIARSATFATDFEIEYRKTYKILRNLLSHDVYVLRQCGTPAELQDLPAYAVGATVIEVPVSSWSTGGTIAVSYLEELGLGPQAAIVDPTWVTSPCVQKLVGCGVTASWDQAGG